LIECASGQTRTLVALPHLMYFCVFWGWGLLECWGGAPESRVQAEGFNFALLIQELFFAPCGSCWWTDLRSPSYAASMSGRLVHLGLSSWDSGL